MPRGTRLDLQLLSAALHLHAFICLAALVRLGPWQVLFRRPLADLLALVVEVSSCVVLVPASKLSARNTLSSVTRGMARMELWPTASWS